MDSTTDVISEAPADRDEHLMLMLVTELKNSSGPIAGRDEKGKDLRVLCTYLFLPCVS
jgi:hypothetical protein